MGDTLARRSIVSSSLARFLNTLHRVNSESLETIDRENYQFQVASEMTCAFEQIKNNLELKRRHLLMSCKDKLNQSIGRSYCPVDEEDRFRSDLPISRSIPIGAHSAPGQPKRTHSSLIHSEPSSLMKSKFTIESSSFTSNNTLDSLSSFNVSDIDSTAGDSDTVHQQSLDSGFSTLFSNSALSPGDDRLLQRNLNHKKDEQAFISNLLYFLNLKNENESTSNSSNDCLDNLPEQIALSLVKVFSKREPSFKIDPNELDCWLVSEQEVPQKLLPIPNNVQFLTQHFNQAGLIREQDENETDASATTATGSTCRQESGCSEPDSFHITTTTPTALASSAGDNLTDRTASMNEEDKLIDTERKRLLGNFLPATSLTTNAKSLAIADEDEMQKLNNLFYNGKFLNFTSLNNVKYRGNSEWAPPRFCVHTHIFSPPKRHELVARQNYRCCGCGLQIEKQDIPRMLYCYYTGKYWCQHGCHSKTKTIIPAYVIHKWSFKLLPVSNHAFQIINNNFTRPLFNIQDLNPKLFHKVKQFQNLHDLRQQLLKLKDYIYRCKKASSLLVVYLTFEPKHFVESTRDLTYSLEDLVDVKKDCKILDRCFNLVHESIAHIKNCSLCSAHGFICELCSNHGNSRQATSSKPDILFPFEIGRVKQCERCYACYHLNCFVGSGKNQCLKCLRIEKRRSSSMMEDEVTNAAAVY